MSKRLRSFLGVNVRRWAEVGLQTNPQRYEALAGYMRELGFESKVEFINVTLDEYPKRLPELLKEFDSIRVGRGLGEVTIDLFNNNTVFIDRLKAADSIIKWNDTWLLRSAAYDGFSKVCARVGNLFDLDSSVLIVGAGAAARLAIAVLFRAGFKTFGISDQTTSKVERVAEELKKVYFGAEFRAIPKDDLILLPGNFGVLVNTTPLVEGNEILDELSYFNFFKRNGVAIDFTIKPVDTPLLLEALDVGATVVKGYEISTYTDIVWAEWFCGVKLDPLVYGERLEKFLREAASP
jgi:shikimate 5-dehydrogenase